jgi:hypothetical protein
VQLSFEVVDRLLQEAMRGFGAVPRRGAEVGGILLGNVERREQTLVRILDYQPVPIEYSGGPSFHLSAKDRNTFERRLEQWKDGEGQSVHAVGFYRSHTREGSLSLAAEDLSLMDALFPEPSAVALLIRPFATRVSVAGFFFREEGAMQASNSCLEFPFRRRELGGGVAPVDMSSTHHRVPRITGDAHDSSFSGPSAPTQGGNGTVPGVPKFLPLTQDRKHRRGWVWIPLSFIFLLFGVLLGFQAALSMRPRASMGYAQDPYSLSMFVSRETDSLVIHWNTRSPAARNAQRAVLTISDGSFTKAIPLDGRQLMVGTVVYKRLANTLRLKMEVYTKDNSSLIETYEYREPLPSPPVEKK